MKHQLAIFTLIVITFFSCSKETATSNSPAAQRDGCIERFFLPVTAHSIDNADIPVVNRLFLINNISNQNYRYYQYTHSSFQTYFPPYAIVDDKNVKVDQYANGLRIFNAQMVFDFDNDILGFKDDNVTKGTSLNTIPALTVTQLRKFMMNNIEQFDHDSNQYKDSCFKAEFGYFNLNAGISYAPEKLIKAWRVTLKNSIYPSEYPEAYYQDADGKLIGYDNGIRTFN